MIRRAISSLARDTKGAAAPLVAIFGVALLGAAGVALDGGLYFAEKGKLQTLTEAATLSAAVYPANAQARAISFLAQNGYPASTLVSVQVGHYCANSTLAPTARFITGTAPANCAGGTLANTAVRLQTTGQSHHFLTGILGVGALFPALSGTATATRIDEAGIEMTTGVLTLDTGIVNSLLSALVGKNIALSTTQVQALVTSNIDAGLMFDALAARVGETGTYSTLLQRTVSLGDLLAACQSATTDTNTANALGTLAGQVGSAVQVPLSGLFGLGVWKNMPVGGANQKQSLRAGLNSYQLIAYAIQSGGQSATANGLKVNVAGVAQVSLIGSASGPLARPRFSFGPSGETTAATSALRIQLKVNVANLGTLINIPGVATASADIPLLIDIGSGTTSISSINCGQEASTDATVGVNSSAGLLNAYIGTLPADAMKQPFKAITASDVTPVTLVSVPLVATVSIKAAVGPIIGGSGNLTFKQVSGGNGIIGHPPYGGTAGRVGNGSMLVPLLSGLGTNLSATVCLPVLGILGQVLNLSCISTGNTVSAVTQPVANILNLLAVDPLVDGLLGALGVQAGFGDTWATGVRCGVPVLV